MFFNVFNNNENENKRSQQDNFRGTAQGDNGGWDNGSYQKCPFCGRNARFIYDRCEHCKSN